MERIFDSNLNIEQLAAYLDGNISAAEMQELDALLDNDALFHSIVEASELIDDTIAAGSFASSLSAINVDEIILPEIPGTEPFFVHTMGDGASVEVTVPSDEVVVSVADESEETDVTPALSSPMMATLDPSFEDSFPSLDSSLDNDMDNIDAID